MDDFRIPPGFKAGCLPRASKVGEWCPLLADRIRILSEAERAERRGTITLRPRVPEILNQGQVGSCASEASVGALITVRSVANLTHVPLNPYFVYHTTSGGRDQGSTIDANLRFMREHGCAPISVWPRSRGWRTRPSEEAREAAKQFRILEFYDIRDLAEMETALIHGFPVVYGANGHAVYKIEPTTAQHGLDVNSWGTNWGDGGFGVWASYARIGWGYGAFAVRTGTENEPLFDR